MKVVAELEGQDYLEADTEDAHHLKVIGCSQVLELVRSLLAKYGKDLSKWSPPLGDQHSDLLVRELLLKRLGKWSIPYAHAEICHCRAVPTHKVDQMIVAGAHTTTQVSRLTMASTACGTCAPEVQKLIAYRLATKV
jgi:bacterioferritin-associated ferredoxin